MKNTKWYTLGSIVSALILMIFVLVFSNVFTNHFKYQNILKTGIETQAEIIDGNYESNLEVMGTSYYRLEYIFVDENNYKHQGKTSETFTYADVLNFIESGYITIKYNPKTFESIESSYHITASIRSSMIIAGVFIVLDLGSWILAIVLVIKEFKKVRISSTGKEYDAVFVSYDSHFDITDNPMYSVSYTWKDEFGQIKNGKSGPEYSYQEARALKNAGTFNIKVVGKESVITTNIFELSMHHFETIKKNKSETTTCVYCGTVYDKKLDRCPSCGAGQSEK